MYKVFINNKPLIFTSKPPKSSISDGVFVLHSSLKESPDFLVHLMESGNVKKGIVLSDKAEESFKKFQNEFKIIQAAGGIVKNDEGEILFIYKNDTWDLPKGKIDKGESPAQAALREIEEETGVADLQLKKKIKSSYHMYSFKKKLVLKKTHWFEVRTKSNGEQTPSAEEGIEKALFISASQIKKEVLKSTYPSLKKMLKEYL